MRYSLSFGRPVGPSPRRPAGTEPLRGVPRGFGPAGGSTALPGRRGVVLSLAVVVLLAGLSDALAQDVEEPAGVKESEGAREAEAEEEGEGVETAETVAPDETEASEETGEVVEDAAAEDSTPKEPPADEAVPDGAAKEDAAAPEVEAEVEPEGVPDEGVTPTGPDPVGPEPPVLIPPVEPVEMIQAEPGRHRGMFRLSLWVARSSSKFWKKPPIASADSFSMEGDFGSFPLKLLLPLEGSIRTETQEFRLRYLGWTSKGAQTVSGADLDFGTATFVDGDRVSATLGTHALGLDFVQRILEKPFFDLYISAGGDLFYTSLALSGAGKSDTLSETIPILTVGLGIRFKVLEDVSASISKSALSYSQLLGLDEEFFGMNDVYQNFEFSVLWERTDWLDLGASWRLYEVSFKSAEDRLEARQKVDGLSVWARLKF